MLLLQVSQHKLEKFFTPILIDIRLTVSDKVMKVLNQYSAIALSTLPIHTSYSTPDPPPKVLKTIHEEGDTKKVADSTPKPTAPRGATVKTVPPQAIPYLIDLVHGNKHNQHALVTEFITFWKEHLSASTPSSVNGATPDDVKIGFSKAQLGFTIKTMASYTKHEENDALKGNLDFFTIISQ